MISANRDTLSILMNGADGQATFTVSQVFQGFRDRLNDVAAGALYGGPVDDIVMAGSKQRTFLNDGSGTFSLQQTVNYSTQAQHVVVADGDGDGDLEILAANKGLSDGSLSAVSVSHRDEVTGLFLDPVRFSVGTDRAFDLTVDDFDGDAAPDVVTINNTFGSSSALRNLNDGTGGFEPFEFFATGADPTSFVAVDFNDDGAPDLAVTAEDRTGNRQVRMLRNDTPGSSIGFTPASPLDSGGQAVHVWSADVTGDGRPDLLAANEPVGPGPVGASIAVFVNEIATPPNLANLTIVTGTLLEGDLDSLRQSDDVFLRTRSGFGSTFIDLHHMEMIVRAQALTADPTSLDSTIESNIDEPAGILQVRLRNWTTGLYDFIERRQIGLNEQVHAIQNIHAPDYVNQLRLIEMSVKHIVFVPFVAFTFESSIDQVEIGVR